MILPSSLVTPSPEGGLRFSSTARVERGPSQGARSASTEDIGGRPLSSLQACSSSLQGWGLIDLPLRAAFSPTRPLADIFHPPYPPIASQSISRDVPLAQARAFRFFIPLLKGVAKAALNCAHRTSTVSSCAFCEQGGHLAAPSSSYTGRGARTVGLVDDRTRDS